MIQCPQCGRENEDTYTYCLGCGTKLPKPELHVQPVPLPAPTMIPCTNCGAQVPSTNKFCGSCGTPVTAPPASAATSRPPASMDYEAQTAPRDPVGFDDRSALGSSPGALGSSPGVLAAGAAAGFASSDLNPLPRTEHTKRRVENVSLGLESSPHTGSVVAKLVVIQPDGTEGATLSLQEGEFTIGSQSEHDALANDPFLSPKHAVVTVRGNAFTIRDLESLNGIFYRIRDDVELESGDFIRVGQELLRFEYMDDVPTLPAPVQEHDTLRGGSPNNGYWGRLALVSGPDIDTRAFAFSEDEINLGREIGDIVFREDGFVSGRHARIYKIGERAKLKDLGSSNGTYVRIRDEKPLRNGDLILMGQQLFKLIA